MPYEFKLRRMVEFAETDMAGIMHFSNYFRFMEATEHAFFRSLGSTVHRHDGGRDGRTMQGWARVHAECLYAAPLHFQDLVEVRLLVREKKEKAISYDFVFRRVDESAGDDGRAVAYGSVTAVYVERASTASSGPAGGAVAAMRSVPMPAEVAGKIDVAPPDVLEAARRSAAKGS